MQLKIEMRDIFLSRFGQRCLTLGGSRLIVREIEVVDLFEE